MWISIFSEQLLGDNFKVYNENLIYEFESIAKLASFELCVRVWRPLETHVKYNHIKRLKLILNYYCLLQEISERVCLLQAMRLEQ